jgi:hypothetical protein
LHDEPVHACPPSALYRFHKFAWRNKAALAIAAVVAFAGVLAVAELKRLVQPPQGRDRLLEHALAALPVGVGGQVAGERGDEAKRRHPRFRRLLSASAPGVVLFPLPFW